MYNTHTRMHTTSNILNSIHYFITCNIRKTLWAIGYTTKYCIYAISFAYIYEKSFGYTENSQRIE